LVDKSFVQLDAPTPAHGASGAGRTTKRIVLWGSQGQDGPRMA
jgi:hypothetical protein